MFNPYSLVGKTILVTGASSGIGRGIAVTCSKMGASVIINGRNVSRLDETLKKMEGTHQMLVGDLTEFEKVPDLVSQLPKLDGIVHCAGIGERTLCKMIETSDIDSIMDANFKAPVFLQSEILRKKKISKGGSIIFIASIAPDLPTVGNGLYAASKGALISYAKCLAVELASRLIRVNCISPAMIWTDLIYKGGLTDEELREDEQKYPLKRYGKPEDVAYLAGYLLSDTSTWMTGNNIKLTGGVY